MKAKYVEFSRLVSTGDYSNKKVGIVLEVEKGEKARDVLAMAKNWVDRQIDGTGYTAVGYLTLKQDIGLMETHLDVVRAKRNTIAYKMSECPEEVYPFLAEKMGEYDGWLAVNSDKVEASKKIVAQIEETDIPF